MIEHFFKEHPRSVGETYAEHLGSAGHFGMTMIGAGLACLVHALVPGLFKKTGSRVILRLHERMIVNRSPAAPTLERHNLGTE